MKLRLTSARIATCAGRGEDDAARMGLVDDGVLVIDEGRVVFLGASADAPPPEGERSLDLGGRLVTPGLVDPHTHLVFAGSRSGEFQKKMAGVDYRTIAREGGGIGASMRATRAASDDALRLGLEARLRVLAAHGVTLVEVKSGYGLSLEHELRLLRLAREARARSGSPAPRVTTTLLGAHAIPPEFREDRGAYVALVAERMVPEAASPDPRRGARALADACDVYLDEGAFSLAEARTILEAARRAGLAIRAHVGQFADLGGAELVASLGGLSCDHLEHVSDAGLQAMARAGTRAVLLPGAWRTLRQAPPDAARMAALGVRIAVGTDANPGTSPSLDPLLAAGLAVRDAGLAPSAALLALTREAARAVGAPDAGRLVAGGRADLAIWDHDDPAVFGYALGGLRPSAVLSAGEALAGSLEALGAPCFT